MPVIRGRRYDTGEPVAVEWQGNRITAVEAVTPRGPVSDWPYLSPGLFDLQINGHNGIWFARPDLTTDLALQALEPHFKFGVTRLFPTLITASQDTLKAGFTAIREACEQQEWADQLVAGCHLEGPHISSEDGPRGAHPRQHCRPADWNEFLELQAASGNRIRLVTLAPEVPGAVGFIRRAVAAGVRIAIGHTAANSEQIAAAVEAGATLSTHLGNGAHGQIRRHPNYIWDQLGDARLVPSLITDGHHLPPAFIRSVIRTKGAGRIIITCDAAGLAGCPPGTYRIESGEVEVLPDGPIVVAGQRQILAGSGQLTDHCVAHAVQVAGLSLGEAFDMAGRIPCRLLGIPEARLRRGSLADLVVFRWAGPGAPFQWMTTISAGQIRFGEIVSAD